MTNGARRLGALHRDQRGLVTAFVVRIVVVFAILLVAVEETGQVVLAQIHASNAAGTAAQAGADSWAVSKSWTKAQTAALQALQADDPKATMQSFSIAKDGSVTVTAAERATTLIVQRLPYVKQFQVQHATETEIHSLASTR